MLFSGDLWLGPYTFDIIDGMGFPGFSVDVEIPSESRTNRITYMIEAR